jgi:hypothetical protein
MKSMFVDELMRRYAITSTLEMAQGTVGPLIKYPEDDIVVSVQTVDRNVTAECCELLWVGAAHQVPGRRHCGECTNC